MDSCAWRFWACIFPFFPDTLMPFPGILSGYSALASKLVLVSYPDLSIHPPPHWIHTSLGKVIAMCRELSTMGGHYLFAYFCVLPCCDLQEGRQCTYRKCPTQCPASNRNSVTCQMNCSLYISCVLLFCLLPGAVRSGLMALPFLSPCAGSCLVKHGIAQNFTYPIPRPRKLCFLGDGYDLWALIPLTQFVHMLQKNHLFTPLPSSVRLDCLVFENWMKLW